MTIPPRMPYAAYPPRPSWWSRNWKWFVPAGCVTLLALAGAFIIGILMLVSGVMRSSDVYRIAMARAQRNPEVVRRLGEPIKSGWFFTGSISVSGPSGKADIAIPISGPKGSGTIYAVARKSAGTWRYRTLRVAIEGSSERIDLLGLMDMGAPDDEER